MEMTEEYFFDASTYFTNLYLTQYRDMSKAETKKLLILAQSGDINARNELILCNLRLIYRIEKMFDGMENRDDMIQEGVFGLINAIMMFDTNRDIAFSTYAWQWVAQAIRRYITNFSETIRISSHMREKIYKYKMIKKANPDWSEDDIMNELIKQGIITNVSQFIRIQSEAIPLYQRTVYLEEPAMKKSDGDSNDLHRDMIADTYSIPVDEKAESKLLSDEILDYVKRIESQRNYEIFILKFCYKYTNVEIANQYGITKQRVDQITHRIADKIKKHNFKFNY